MKTRIAAATAGVLAATAFGMVATAAPAQAYVPDNKCGGVIDVDYCLWYDAYQQGGWTATYRNIADWGNDGGYPWWFSDGGDGTAGVGTRVKNNAASYANSHTSRWGVSYYNENYSGASDWAAPQTMGQLNHTWNDNASFAWG